MEREDADDQIQADPSVGSRRYIIEHPRLGPASSLPDVWYRSYTGAGGYFCNGCSIFHNWQGVKGKERIHNAPGMNSVFAWCPYPDDTKPFLPVETIPIPRTANPGDSGDVDPTVLKFVADSPHDPENSGVHLEPSHWALFFKNECKIPGVFIEVNTVQLLGRSFRLSRGDGVRELRVPAPASASAPPGTIRCVQVEVFICTEAGIPFSEASFKKVTAEAKEKKEKLVSEGELIEEACKKIPTFTFYLQNGDALIFCGSKKDQKQTKKETEEAPEVEADSEKTMTDSLWQTVRFVVRDISAYPFVVPFINKARLSWKFSSSQRTDNIGDFAKRYTVFLEDTDPENGQSMSLSTTIKDGGERVSFSVGGFKQGMEIVLGSGVLLVRKADGWGTILRALGPQGGSRTDRLRRNVEGGKAFLMCVKRKEGPLARLPVHVTNRILMEILLGA
uniref:Uncharacterized protein n=1 Tax=Chromera velia CCMP2878 TaxID=1169474 RepID=A0A0G4I2D8_9ALVE|eukprot:Cvel_10337.t1-p1 / transcript=Cvel_10337.t1 / gene=Cvel_10337 / organism=Chromera_velia_CCMP2878 / gene_product=hypothetical protein / transcript_product=hypothetical protein / location=Cvel_scaffold621:5549-11290(+) / protein_length=447 / sequence_SO=supercontig / SO=protein_coding / is_pseudo=false